MKINRILIVGLGSIGKRHVRLVNELYPDVEVAILRHKKCDKNGESGLKITRCFSDVDDAIQYKPDMAIISNPASMHIDIATKLASESIHLMVEKPISSNSNGVDKLIKLCEENKVLLMTAYNLRFSESLNKFYNLLYNNCMVGKVLSVHIEVESYLPSWRPDTDYRRGVSAQKVMGGGVLLELSHEIDYLVWMFGEVEWVQSMISKQSNLELDVEDTANILIGINSQNHKIVATLNMSFIRHDSTRTCTVIGENGTLRWNGIDDQVDIYISEKKCWDVEYSNNFERDDTYKRELSHFFSCIENDDSPIVDGRDGLKVIKIIEAIRLSNKDEKRIYLNG